MPFQLPASIGQTWQCAEILAAIAITSLTSRGSLANQVLRLRMESHRSPGLLQQLRLVFWSGLACRLYVLSSQIETLKLKVEVRRDTIFLTEPPTNKERLS
jgi:hypothetical protein